MSDQPTPAEPRCPSCGWHLTFTAENRTWVARCPNRPVAGTAGCPVDIVPPNIDTPTLTFVRAHEPTCSTDVARHFGWKLPNANARLEALRRLGLLTRRAVDPVRSGKRFAWSSTGPGASLLDRRTSCERQNQPSPETP